MVEQSVMSKQSPSVNVSIMQVILQATAELQRNSVYFKFCFPRPQAEMSLLSLPWSQLILSIFSPPKPSPEGKEAFKNVGRQYENLLKQNI